MGIMHIYKNELEVIEDILRNELKGKNYSVELGDYKYDSLDSIPDQEPDSNGIKLSISEPYFSVSFDKTYTSIYSGSNNLESEGAVEKIAGYLSKIRNKSIRFGDTINKLFPFIGGGLLGISTFPLILYKQAFYTMVSIIIVSLINIVGFVWSSKRSTTIYFNKKRDTFFVRHRDQIMLGLMFAVVGAVLGAIVTKLLSGQTTN